MTGTDGAQMTQAAAAVLPDYTGPRCVLPGCKNPTAASTQPCVVCLRELGGMLVQTTGPGLTDEQVRERDEATRRALVEQAASEQRHEQWKRRNAELLGDDALGMEKAMQLCEVCEERRTCVRVVARKFGSLEWWCRACVQDDIDDGRRDANGPLL